MITANLMSCKSSPFPLLDEEQIFLKGIGLLLKGILSGKYHMFRKILTFFKSKEIKFCINGKKREQKRRNTVAWSF